MMHLFNNAENDVMLDAAVEVTPDAIRLRKKGLTAMDRRNLYRQKMAAQEQ